MNGIKLHWFLDKLSILFIVLCVFAFEFPFMGIPLRYYVIAFILFLSFGLCKKEFSNIVFISFCVEILITYSILMLYSVIIRGNNPENFLFFIKPFMIFLVIPAYSYLFRKYGTDRYLNAFMYAMIGLVALFFYILIRSAIEPGYGLGLNDRSKLLVVAYYDFLPRVIFENFVFIVPFAVMLMAKNIGKKMHLCFFLMVTIALLSQTLGLVLALIVVYLIVLVKRRSIKVLIPMIIAGVVGYAVYVGFAKDTIVAAKENSADYKSAQLNNYNKDLGTADWFFGRGLGCTFKNFDERNLDEPVIEIAGVQIFQSGGLLLTWLIMFPYILPALPFVLSRRGDKILQLLALSQVGIFFASMANPYIWSGSVGLLFMMLFVARKSSLLNKYNG